MSSEHINSSNKSTVKMLAVLYVNAFVAAYCNSIMNVALVDVMNEFSITSTTAQWLVSGYTIITIIVVACMAFVFKRLPARKIFLLAQVLFVVSGIGCVFAPNFPVLLAARLLQGVATGLSTPLMMNAVMAAAEPSKRGFMLAIGSTIITLGPAFAPIICGFIITTLGWHMIFVVPLVLNVICIVAGHFWLQDFNETGSASLDVPSAVILALGLTVFAFGLTRVMSEPLLGVASLVIGAAILAVFALRQRGKDQPFLNLKPLLSVRFWPACVMTLGALMATFSVNILLPLYVEQGMGFTAFDAGVMLLATVIFNTITSPIAGKVVDRFGPFPLLPIGFSCILGGQIALACLAGTYLLPALVVAGCFICGGVGLTSSPSQVTGLSSLPRELYPHGVSIMSVFIQLSGCLAPSLYVGVMNATQSSALSAGVQMAQAVASSLTAAELVAAVMSAIALITSLVYAFRILNSER